MSIELEKLLVGLVFALAVLAMVAVMVQTGKLTGIYAITFLGPIIAGVLAATGMNVAHNNAARNHAMMVNFKKEPS